jgi:N,N'-diacetyllegionaminate synthase
MVSIQKHTIGEGQRCFIIAEAGVNHNGEMRLAKKLIDAAQVAGADAIKFQTFVTSNLVTRTAGKAAYQTEHDPGTSSQFEMLQKLELSEENFFELSRYAKKKGILFLSTAFDLDSIGILSRIGVPAFKIPSGEITNLPYLKEIALMHKPVILSTGMSTIADIQEALSCLKRNGCSEIILLHCTSSYPAPLSSVNLRVIATLRQQFGIPVGYSDHTEGIVIPIAAAALGACILEKHLTIDRNLSGPDHMASIEPENFTQMVTAVREVECALGTGEKQPQECEMENRRIARKSIVAAVTIPAGIRLTPAMLAIKRPGTGIEPKHLEQVIGKQAKSEIKMDSVISWDMVE